MYWMHYAFTSKGGVKMCSRLLVCGSEVEFIIDLAVLCGYNSLGSAMLIQFTWKSYVDTIAKAEFENLSRSFDVGIFGCEGWSGSVGKNLSRFFRKLELSVQSLIGGYCKLSYGSVSKMKGPT